MGGKVGKGEGTGDRGGREWREGGGGGRGGGGGGWGWVEGGDVGGGKGEGGGL